MRPIPRFTTALVLLTLGLIGLAYADAVRLENDALRVELDPEHGAPTQFTDKVTGHNHVEAPQALWTLTPAEGKEVRPEEAGHFASEADESGLKLTWDGFGRTDAPDLRVTARVSVDGAESRWRLEMEGLGELVPRAVHFPRLADVARQEDETLAVPVWMGEKTTRARDLLNANGNPGRLGWEYPGLLSMQCMAFYRDQGPGLLLSTNDTDARRKEFAVFGDGNGGVGLEVVHVPPEGKAQRYETPCDVLVRAFNGDWFTAAELYRQWARQQRWVTESRIRQAGTPPWVLDTGLWVWNRGRSPGVLEPAAVLQEHAGVPVSVFWHWWHGCSYDTGFPEYLPPREGEEPFRRAMAEANAKGLHAIVYMNQRLWGMRTQSWTDEGAERYAVKRPDGQITPEVYNVFTKAPCVSMCMGTEFWRNKYAGLAEAAVETLGVDGIYMDQACSSLACYDPAHGHPLGGGTYWMEGFHRLEADIRRRTADVKAVALAGEGTGEAWLPHLDAMLSLQVSLERYSAPGEREPIPFFHAVYHDCAVFYGNYSSLTRPPYDDLWPKEFAPERPLELLDRKFSTQFRLEQARAFVWGQQPTLANFLPSHLEERKEELDFVMGLARLRVKAAKYLRDGTFLRPPEIDAPEAEIPMSRLSIYAGQQDAVKEFSKTVPMVLAAAWQAPDGDVGVALVNIAGEGATVHLSLSKAEYPLPEQGAVYRLAEQSREAVAEYEQAHAEFGANLAPYETCVYELQALRE